MWRESYQQAKAEVKRYRSRAGGLAGVKAGLAETGRVIESRL